MGNTKRTIIFVATNGVGLGHMTRLIAIAKRVRALDPEIEILFLSTSTATEVLRKEGFMYFYLPSRAIMRENIDPKQWNDMIHGLLGSILQLYSPQMLIFDGAYPYGGVIGLFKKFPKMWTLWIKREEYKAGGSTLVEHEGKFKQVLVPKEAGKIYDDEDTRLYCDPIVSIEPHEVLSREEVRKLWGVSKNQEVFYVQLGAGAINAIQDELNIVVGTLLKDPNHFVVVGQSIIGLPLKLNYENTRLRIIEHYPNAKYFYGCDYAISATGYNTYHELIYLQIPSIFIPNTKTGKDNQWARAMHAQDAGAAVCLEEVNEQSLEVAIQQLHDNKESMSQNCRKLINSNGAWQAAHYIIDHLNEIEV